MLKHLSALVLALGVTTLAASAETTVVSGKIVDLATWVTHDHNMDSMMHKGGSMKGDAMHHDAMKDDAMNGAMHHDAMKGDAMNGAMHHDAACPPTLGIITATGQAYSLATQMGSPTTAALCKKVNASATVSGTLYTQGGISMLLISSVK